MENMENKINGNSQENGHLKTKEELAELLKKDAHVTKIEFPSEDQMSSAGHTLRFLSEKLFKDHPDNEFGRDEVEELIKYLEGPMIFDTFERENDARRLWQDELNKQNTQLYHFYQTNRLKHNNIGNI